MHSDLFALLPQDKLETHKAQAIVALGYPAAAPILMELVEWLQDINWPVARVLQPFLASIGAPLAPYVRHVLNSTDDTWKYWTIRFVVCESPELAESLLPELRRIAYASTRGEIREALDMLVKEIIEGPNH